MRASHTPWRAVWLALPLAACSGGDVSRNGTVSVPARAGDVWEADRAEDRVNAAASLVAFVNGLHVVVVDGDDVYAGTTRHRASTGDEGARALSLVHGLRAELVPVGEVLELRFSSGETLPMRRQPERGKR
jgi:hypothetical protein